VLEDRSSATFRALHPEEAEWSTEAHLLALLAELLDRIDRTLMSAHAVDSKGNRLMYSESGIRQLTPLRVRRPGQTEAESAPTGKRRVPLAEFLAFVNRGRGG
jgi:hypothetical protein